MTSDILTFYDLRFCSYVTLYILFINNLDK